MKKYFGLRGSALNWAVGLIAGCDFLLFGYGRFYHILLRDTMAFVLILSQQTKE